MKIAVIGGGVAGLGAAWSLNRVHDVTLFEAADRLGGHANTVDIQDETGSVPVDTGFIVYNETNYPNLTRLFAQLGVETVASDMSFAVSMDRGRFEYAGSLPGLFGQPGNLGKPAFWRLLLDLWRFYRAGPALAARTDLEGLTVQDLLSAGRYSASFAERHLLPMGAAIWSASVQEVRDFPLERFVRFFDQHGLLRLTARPQWRTVAGGSRRYVERLSAPFRHRIRLGNGIVALSRGADSLVLRDARGGEHRFDQAVLATHADRALDILGAAASAAERQVLGAFRYSANRAVLHTDPALMPRRRRLWSSWNHVTPDPPGRGAAGPVSVSYWMNRLQRLDATRDIFVSLNPPTPPDPHRTRAEFVYRHPLFDRHTAHAQARLPAIQGPFRVWFCGSYCGYGFHEDGLRAGLDVAGRLGAPAPWRVGAEPAAGPATAPVTR